MQLVTIRTGDTTSAGVLDGGQVRLLPFDDVGEVLRSPAGLSAVERDDGRVVDYVATDLAPLVLRPGKIICLGWNYISHIEEMGREQPEHPTLFAKFADALIGANDPIRLPIGMSNQVDWEVELALVIGTEVRHADRSEAAAAIAGFTVLNDVSVRDFQRRTTQWLQGKTFESTCPVGPALVTVDEVGSATPDLLVECEINGEPMQVGRTSDLLFDPPEIVRYISSIVRLRPGDLIATGTPGGVGASLTPPVYLADGDVVTTRIEGLGQLVNPCTAA